MLTSLVYWLPLVLQQKPATTPPPDNLLKPTTRIARARNYRTEDGIVQQKIQR